MIAGSSFFSASGGIAPVVFNQRVHPVFLVRPKNIIIYHIYCMIEG